MLMLFVKQTRGEKSKEGDYRRREKFIRHAERSITCINIYTYLYTRASVYVCEDRVVHMRIRADAYACTMRV